ncbi:uncharacterized protein MYCGRDRAFT_97914 [Zymoseptoria tritici IPO323]|uniref:Uncharacterized protein n=1 Tax=Zymoseptoria tritici (strain CBS 115943 / IPO323) TaxID=336722 RepID=F9XRR9_ZYMTI|nr:uncharacterized protein MYCGRDRAFT_97914 [Zymoseptoria tritici IPO323]EGP82050.1 hypothetical protein MYCGRDRAFT_97914 [Zymoseptoria tritici IPO323]
MNAAVGGGRKEVRGGSKPDSGASTLDSDAFDLDFGGANNPTFGGGYILDSGAFDLASGGGASNLNSSADAEVPINVAGGGGGAEVAGGPDLNSGAYTLDSSDAFTLKPSTYATMPCVQSWGLLSDDVRQKSLQQQAAHRSLPPRLTKVVSSIAASLRFDLDEFQTNLVPYPRIHFPLVATRPMACSRSNVPDDDLARVNRARVHVSKITGLVRPVPQVRPWPHALLYCGDVVVKDVHQLSSDKFDLMYSKPPLLRPGPLCPTNSVDLMYCKSKRAFGHCIPSNNTAIAEVWSALFHEVDLMYSKRAFVPWYVGEGMEKGERTWLRSSAMTRRLLPTPPRVMRAIRTKNAIPLDRRRGRVIMLTCPMSVHGSKQSHIRMFLRRYPTRPTPDLPRVLAPALSIPAWPHLPLTDARIAI